MNDLLGDDGSESQSGKELEKAVVNYPRWAKGLFCDAHANRFRHHPQDYIDALEQALVTVAGQHGHIAFASFVETYRLLDLMSASTHQRPGSPRRSFHSLTLSIMETVEGNSTLGRSYISHTRRSVLCSISALCYP